MAATAAGYAVLDAANAALYLTEMPAPRPETIARISRAPAGNIDTLLIYARARYGQRRTSAERGELPARDPRRRGRPQTERG